MNRATSLGSFRRLCVVGLSLGVAGSSISFGATPDAAPVAQFEGTTAVSWVLVPVVVRGPRGYVTRLDASDFELFVDDQPRRFETFDTDPEGPVSLIHLQDLSGSMAATGKLDGGREALEYFLRRLRPGDEIALATFASGRTDVEVPFTGDVTPLREALGLWRGYGTTALHDAVAWLPEIGLEGRNARRAAIVVTDGADNASALEPHTARDLVRRARLPVYVIALGGAERRKGTPPPKDETLLRLLAFRTGGRYFSMRDSAAIPDVCEAIAQELRHQYVLGFRTRADTPQAHHAIRVHVTRGKDLEIIHRAGYHGGSP